MTKKNPRYIRYCAGYKYQLTRNYTIRIPITGHKFEAKYFALNVDGTMTIMAGYAWDGPSGPTLDTKSFMRGSLIHDVLYQAMRLELLDRSYREIADKILRDICIEDGMWRWRANIVYRSVRLWAAPAAHPDCKRRELTAP